MIRKMSSMKCFQNKIRCRNARMMERSSLLMKKNWNRGSHPYFYRISKSEIEDCEDCTNCMRGEQFVGRRGLYSSFLYEENYGFYAIIM